ncbi:protein of unknown function [Tenacibaculum soleae]|uniref:hypothetical protein n=1 Tax=Tenacibaculum soleae TaxID=447689 RepID=UPI003AB6CAEA
MTIQNYIDRFEKIEKEADELDKDILEEKIHELEEQLSFDSDYFLREFDSPEFIAFEKLQKRIKLFKNEYDFYDEKGTLDMMFPERHEDDFDEDSMNYDSIFGKD